MHMWPASIYHCSLVSILMAFFLFSLSSCSKPSPAVDEPVSSKKMLLVNMGNGVCQQLPSGLMWQIQKSQNFSTLNEANEYVSTLNLAGFDDWQLPTRSEYLGLAELLEFKLSDCPIKINQAHWVINNKGECGYWEDYPLCGGSEFRWVKDKKGYVRGVRRSK